MVVRSTDTGTSGPPHTSYVTPPCFNVSIREVRITAVPTSWAAVRTKLVNIFYVLRAMPDTWRVFCLC